MSVRHYEVYDVMIVLFGAGLCRCWFVPCWFSSSRFVFMYYCSASVSGAIFSVLWLFSWWLLCDFMSLMVAMFLFLKRNCDSVCSWDINRCNKM